MRLFEHIIRQFDVNLDISALEVVIRFQLELHILVYVKQNVVWVHHLAALGVKVRNHVRCQIQKAVFGSVIPGLFAGFLSFLNRSLLFAFLVLFGALFLLFLAQLIGQVPVQLLKFFSIFIIKLLNFLFFVVRFDEISEESQAFGAFFMGFFATEIIAFVHLIFEAL